VRLDDLKYFVDGEQVSYLEWKEWKRYHIPEWLKIRSKQMELLGSLKKLRGDIFMPAANGGENRIELRSDVQEVVNKVNALGAGC